MRLRLLSDAQTNVVLTVITQEPDQANAALLATTAPLSAHRSDVYLPPLAPLLLAELGLDARARRVAIESVREVAHAASVAAERSAMESACMGFCAAPHYPSHHSASFLAPLSVAEMAAAGVASGEVTAGSTAANGGESMQVTRQMSLGRGTSFDQLTRESWQEHERRYSGMQPPLRRLSSPSTSRPASSRGQSSQGTPVAATPTRGSRQGPCGEEASWCA